MKVPRCLCIPDLIFKKLNQAWICFLRIHFFGRSARVNSMFTRAFFVFIIPVSDENEKAARHRIVTTKCETEFRRVLWKNYIPIC